MNIDAPESLQPRCDASGEKSSRGTFWAFPQKGNNAGRDIVEILMAEGLAPYMMVERDGKSGADIGTGNGNGIFTSRRYTECSLCCVSG